MPSARWKRLDELFQGAVALTGEARSAFLDARCSDSSEIRREVEELLEAHDLASTFLERPAAEQLAGAGRRLSWIGRQLGPYQILKELGRGGMSTVYLAHRVDQEYRSLVAVKRLRPELASGALERRFRVERQILARLRHPAIARILDAGTTGEGSPYFVMELIEGLPIDRHCDQERLSVRERLALFLRVCDAVQYAHRNLVVHRDLKPSNILITPEGDPKLLDFGIAKLLAPEDYPELVEETLTRMRPMTPRYASPEQALGRSITTSSDVYSLGVLLYELLSGVSPYSFAGKKPSEIETILLHEEPPAPSTRGEAGSPAAAERAARRKLPKPEALRRLLAGDLDNIVGKALRKETEARYASVEGLAEDLRRYLEGRPVLARSSGRLYRIGKLVRRNRATVGVASAALFLLLGFTVFTLLQADRLRDERELARRERFRAEEVTGFLVEAFRRVDPGQARGEEVTAREVVEQAAQQVGTDLAGEPALQATLMHTLGDVYGSLGMFEPARELLDRAVEVRRRLDSGGESPSVAESLAARGAALLEIGEFEAAEADALEALEIRRRLDSGAVPASLDLLGRVVAVLGRRDEALALHEEALELRRRGGLAGRQELAESLAFVALANRVAGDLGRSAELYREALEAQRAAVPGDHPVLAEILHNLAIVLRRLGDLAEAEAACQEAIAMNRRLYDGPHLNLSRNFNSLALIRKEQGEHAEAAELHRRNIGLKAELFGADHPRLAISMSNLAFLLLHHLERPGEAVTWYERAIEIYLHGFGEHHPNLVPFSIGLGQALNATGRPSEAEPVLRRALARSELEEDPVRAAQAQSALGESLRLTGQPEQAESLLREAHAFFAGEYGLEDFDTRLTRRHLEALYRDLGRSLD